MRISDCSSDVCYSELTTKRVTKRRGRSPDLPLLADVQHQRVLLELVAMLLRDFLLQLFDLGALELDDPAGVHVHHVVVVAAAVDLVDRSAALEVVLEHQTRGLELRQHAVDGGDRKSTRLNSSH